jgi:hypothetical protein
MSNNVLLTYSLLISTNILSRFRFMDLRSESRYVASWLPSKRPQTAKLRLARNSIPKFMIRNALLSAGSTKDHIRSLLRLVPMHLSIRLPLRPAGYVAPLKSLSSAVNLHAFSSS